MGKTEAIVGNEGNERDDEPPYELSELGSARVDIAPPEKKDGGAKKMGPWAAYTVNIISSTYYTL